MGRTGKWGLVACLLVLGIALAWWQSRDADNGHGRLPVASAWSTAKPAQRASVPDKRLSPEQQAMLARPEAQDYREWTEFEGKMRALAKSDAPLSTDEQAAVLADLARYQAMGRVTPNEAALWRLSLARRQGDEALKAEAERLVAAVKADQEKHAAEAAAHPDPAFLAYKARERAIVAEVQAMTTIPGGLSRDEYLRQRLQQAREEAWKTAGE